MTEEDPHSPTSAGPEPGGVPLPEPAAEPAAADPAPAADPVPEPTPTVGPDAATFEQPAGSALFGGTRAHAPVDPHPEKLVGAAFAGGVVAALFLKSLARRRHA